MNNGFPTFDLDLHFGDDYLHFGDAVNPPEVSDREADAIWKLLSLRKGNSVLELGCGYGRIANRLAKNGVQVTGLDTSQTLLKKAKADAEELQVCVEYCLGDMRSLSWRDRFDAAVLWYTTFGYFDEADNERVLHEAALSLKKGGRLLIETANRFASLRDKWPNCEVVQRDDDLRITILNYDALTDRQSYERTVIRNGRLRRTRLSVRFYGFSEYVRMLRSAGFDTIEAHGQEGEEFTPYGPRLIVVASK